jgi:hypothetical protein
MLCSTWNTIIKLKVPDILKGIPSEKLLCPIGQIKKTTVVAVTGVRYATSIQVCIPTPHGSKVAPLTTLVAIYSFETCLAQT